jgi:dTMP kinase
VLEGIDGCGKSTQARLLAESLGAVSTAEPGATHLGAQLRALLLDSGDEAVSVRSEALLVAADRAQHVEEVLVPNLDSGVWVVSDRFNASTLAYQGYGRGLDVGELKAVVGFASCGLEPDLQILLDVPVDAARSRTEDVARDRFERLGEDFFTRVREGYLALVAADPDHWQVVDGTAEVKVVESRIRDAISGRFGSLPETARR